MDKAAFRKLVLEKRNLLSAEKIDLLSKKICKNLFYLPEAKNSETIGIYFSYGSEVGTRETIEKLLASKKTVCVPAMDFEKNRFDFCELGSLGETKKNKIGIPEPIEKKFVEPKKIGLFVVPGIAFDLEGNRIGTGKGYYDKFFSENKITAQKVGLAFEFQVLERIPSEKHDVKMDFLVTESAVVKF